MSLFLIAYKSPQSDEKENGNKPFVLIEEYYLQEKT